MLIGSELPETETKRDLGVVVESSMKTSAQFVAAMEKGDLCSRAL